MVYSKGERETYRCRETFSEEKESRISEERYSTIVQHSYPFPRYRKRSSVSHRAVQFFTFAALKGYEEMLAGNEGG